MAPKVGSSTVSRRKFIVAAGATGLAGLAGCTANDGGGGNGGGNGGSTAGGNGGENVSGPVTITGSSTVYPITIAMAEEFEKEHEDVTIDVSSTGSGGGFENHFCPGDSDINGASRPIKDEEEQNCESNGVTPAEFQVASDALTVAVNNEADWVDCVTKEELGEIWGPDAPEQWSDVNEDWPDEAFELFGPATTSGTFDWFTENVVGEAGAHRSDYEPTEDDNRIVRGIEGSPHAMGYFGFAYYSENQNRIKGLEIDGEEGCTPPDLDSAKEGTYPLARPLFVYPSEEALREKPQVAAFMRYYIENSQTELVSDIGYVPSNEEQRDENLDKLDEIVG